MGHARQLQSDDKPMRVTCYLIWALSAAVWVGLIVYAIFR